jgi:hypothetical protein
MARPPRRRPSNSPGRGSISGSGSLRLEASARGELVMQPGTGDRAADALDKRIEDSGKAANRGPDDDNGTAGTLANTG